MSAETFNFFCTIEIPYKSRMKYEIDENNNIILDRVIPKGFAFPGNYGFIPQTIAGDADPLDVLLITDYPIVPKCSVLCRPIGVLIMTDEKGLDEKIIAVPAKSVDKSYEHIFRLDDLSKRLLNEIELFFRTYKSIDDSKWTKVHAFRDVDEAIRLIRKYAE